MLLRQELMCRVDQLLITYRAIRILLNDKIQEPLLILIACGRIRLNRRLLIALLFELGDQCTGNTQSAHCLWILKLEAELLCVVVDIFHFVEC